MLQVACDRVSLKQAKELAQLVNAQGVIFEMGTSLVKDYGLIGMKEIRQVLTDSLLLIDLKTIDEGAYEFTQGFEAGGDILTVMGAASLETLESCYEVAEKYGKKMMIDLLEVNDEKISQLVHLKNAIFCLHHSVDKKEKQDPVKAIQGFKQKFPTIKHLAIAGGIDLSGVKSLRAEKVEIIIVGSKITKAKDVVATLQTFIKGEQA